MGRFAIHLLMPVLLVLTLARCGSRVNAGIDLSGPWKIIVTDSDAVSGPAYDDSSAGEISLPGNWNHLLRNNDNLSGTIWLRKKIIIGKELQDKSLVLMLGSIGIVDETYVNGVYVGGIGQMPSGKDSLDYSFTWHRDRKYVFSSKLIAYGRENLIAVKIFSHYINGMKDRPLLMTGKQFNDEYWFWDYIPSYNSFMPIIISVILFLFLAILVMGSGSRLIHLYAILFFTSVLIIYILLLGIPDFSNGLLRYKMYFLIYAFIDYMLVLLVQQFFNVKIRAATYAGLLLFAALTGWVVFSPNTRHLVYYCGMATYILVMMYIIYIIFAFISALYRDPRRYWYLIFVAVFLLSSVANSLYYQFTHQLYKMSFYFVLRLPVILTGGVFVMIIDLKNVQRERDSLARALIRKSKELQRIIKDTPSVGVKAGPKDVIHDLIMYLDNNFYDTYDRKKLAEKFGMNEDYMGQIFKKITGTNIAHYINARRIEAAKQLLIETDSKVIDIAFHVGFDNLTYFYRCFGNETGLTPTDFRRRAGKGFLKKLDMEDEVW